MVKLATRLLLCGVIAGVAVGSMGGAWTPRVGMGVESDSYLRGVESDSYLRGVESDSYLRGVESDSYLRV